MRTPTGRSRTRRIAVVLLLTACGGLVWWVFWGHKANMIDAALAYGRLAELPPSATEVRAATIGNPFARTFWLRFEADAEEIDAFVAASPGLADTAVVNFFVSG